MRTRGRLLLLFLALICLPALAPAGQPRDAEVQRQLADILAAPEYNRASAQPNQLQRALDWLSNAIAAFFKWLGGSLSVGDRSAGHLLSFVLALLVVALFGLLLVLIVRKLARMQSYAHEPDFEVSGEYELPSPKPLIRDAAKMAEAGDYRGAFKSAYMASISFLADVNALRFERSRTNWEYLRELKNGGHDEPYRALRDVTLTFDRRFYGREDCVREDYLDALTAYQKISGEAVA